MEFAPTVCGRSTAAPRHAEEDSARCRRNQASMLPPSLAEIWCAPRTNDYWKWEQRRDCSKMLFPLKQACSTMKPTADIASPSRSQDLIGIAKTSSMFPGKRTPIESTRLDRI